LRHSAFKGREFTVYKKPPDYHHAQAEEQKALLFSVLYAFARVVEFTAASAVCLNQYIVVYHVRTTSFR
jgi:hypothetical protein